MAVPYEKLDQMYWMGYCDEVIRFASKGEGCSEDRVRFLREHLANCTDCDRANKFKCLEADVYQLLGRMDLFNAGEDASHIAEYKDAVKAVMYQAKSDGFINSEDEAWVTDKVPRTGKPWPGRLN